MKNTRFFEIDRRAITMVETMAAVFIFTIVGALFVHGITKVNSLYHTNNQMAAFISDAHIASMHLLSNIRPARLASVSNSDKTLTLEYYDDTVDPDVTYTFSGSELKSGTTTVASNVNIGASSFSKSDNVVTIDILFEHGNIKYPVRIRGKVRSA